MSCSQTKIEDVQDRTRTRERLKVEKPLVYEKFLRLDELARAGQPAPPVIEIAYRYACNLKCKHCFASQFTVKDRSLNTDDLRNLSQQASEMGCYQFILQGGEPILWKDFDQVVEALDPKRFYLGLVTNAALLTPEKVRHLREIGIDKIVMSLDSFDPQEFEQNRGKKGLFDHCVKMLVYAREVGLRVVINTLATKQSVRQPQLLNLIEFAKEHGFIVYVNFAAPIGSWEGRYDVLLDEDDADYVYKLNQEHEIVKRDIYPFQGEQTGCPAFRSVIYVTEYGDVLPCPFVHMTAGNLFENSLAEIIEEGMKVSWFRKKQPVCLACEDKTFIQDKISMTYDRETPVPMREIFTADEYRE